MNKNGLRLFGRNMGLIIEETWDLTKDDLPFKEISAIIIPRYPLSFLFREQVKQINMVNCYYLYEFIRIVYYLAS